MRKCSLGLRLGLAGVLLFGSVALVSAGRIVVSQYSATANDVLMARTYKLVGGGGMPPVMPTEQTIETKSPMTDTNNSNYNYIYAREFDDADKYPVGSTVKWKVNHYTHDFDTLIPSDELSRGQSVAE